MRPHAQGRGEPLNDSAGRRCSPEIPLNRWRGGPQGEKVSAGRCCGTWRRGQTPALWEWAWQSLAMAGGGQLGEGRRPWVDSGAGKGSRLAGGDHPLRCTADTVTSHGQRALEPPRRPDVLAAWTQEEGSAGDRFEGHQLWLKARGLRRVRHDFERPRRGLETVTSFTGHSGARPPGGRPHLGDRLASCVNGHFMAMCRIVLAVDTLSPSSQWGPWGGMGDSIQDSRSHGHGQKAPEAPGRRLT